MKRKDWYPLDNSAKIYPTASNANRTNMFAISVYISEKVEPNILQEALDSVLERVPFMRTKLRRGLFWYYLEKNTKQFVVRPEYPNIFRKLDPKTNNDFLFRLTYFENKITLCMFHILADGNGAMEVLKAILLEYMKLKNLPVKGEGEVLTVENTRRDDEDIDDFLTYYDSKNVAKTKEEHAYKIVGTPFDYGGSGIITGKLKVSELKPLVKEHSATITEYLTALIIQNCYECYIKKEIKKRKNDKPVAVFIPVNLRKYLPSKTLRNFISFIRIKVRCDKEMSFEEILELVKQSMKEKMDPVAIKQLIDGYVKYEKNALIRLVPLFIKDIAMRIGYYKMGERINTMTLSNLGLVKFPKTMQPYIKDITVSISTGPTTVRNCCLISYGDDINISFTRSIVETDFEKNFFRHFSAKGLNIEINSNYWEKRI